VLIQIDYYLGQLWTTQNLAVVSYFVLSQQSFIPQKKRVKAFERLQQKKVTSVFVMSGLIFTNHKGIIFAITFKGKTQNKQVEKKRFTK